MGRQGEGSGTFIRSNIRDRGTAMAAVLSVVVRECDVVSYREVLKMRRANFGLNPEASQN